MANTNTSATQIGGEGVKAQLKALLGIEGIEKIYFVDEVNDIMIEEAIGFLMKGLSIGKEQEIQQIAKESLSLDYNAATFTDSIREIWENLGQKKQSEFMTQITKLVDGQRAEDQITGSQLQFFFDDLTLLTPAQWEEQKTILSKSTYKVMVLFDEELGDKSPRKGHNFIEEIVSNQWSSIIPIIFSFKISSFADELPWRNDLVQNGQSNLKKGDFFALSKKRKDDPDAFVDGIKKALLNSYCETIKNESITVMRTAFQNALEDLSNWDTYDFDHVILKSSYKEGIWEPFTLERIMRIKFEDLLARQMIDSNYAKNINPAIQKAREFSGFQFDVPKKEEPSLHRYKLRYSELYANGDEVNKLNLPVENGDIFEIYQGKLKGKYVLVGQECDLMVRTNKESKGKRTSDVAILLKISPKTNAELDEELTKYYDGNKMLNFWDNKYHLPYFDFSQELNGIVKFAPSTRLIVDLDIIDLVVYNHEGKADFDLFGTKPDLLTFSAAWEFRYDRIKDKFEKAAKTINQIGSDISKFDAQSQKLILTNTTSVKLSFIQASGIEPSFQNNRFSYGIRRIGRLRSELARHLLEKYTSYLSRKAFGHDFAKEIE